MRYSLDVWLKFRCPFENFVTRDVELGRHSHQTSTTTPTATQPQGEQLSDT